MPTIVDALGTGIELPAVGTIADPKPGELWVVRNDGEDMAIVLIVATSASRALVWPVTARRDWDSYPAIHFDGPGVEQQLTGWPMAEFGMSISALGRCVAAPFDANKIVHIRILVENAFDSERFERYALNFALDQESDEFLDGIDAVCRQAWSIADLEWPAQQPGVSAFDKEALEQHGIDAALIAQELPVNPHRASQLLQGQLIPTTEDLEILARAASISNISSLLMEPRGQMVNETVRPVYKQDIEAVAGRRSITEDAARSLVFNESQVAARQSSRNGEDAISARVRDAITRLLLGE